MALTRAWGSGATSRRRTTRLLAEVDRANTEIALLEEELRIKDGRWKRIAPRRRPYYRPVQRMRILKLKAARGWSASQTAGVFGVTQETITSWLMRVDEEGKRALVQLPEPVNRFPDFVGHFVRWLKSICPTMGKVRIAQVLARAGLRLGATTVGRMLKEGGPLDEADDVAVTEDGGSEVTTRVVTAKHPDHVWNVDLTVIPTAAGFWVPWFPFSLPQRWPFCWWLAVAVDHFSRRLQGFAIFVNKPCAEEVCVFLDRAVERVGARPKHIITDQGGQFISDEFAAWCGRRGVRPRKGAVGKQGSIAIVERLIRSVKHECTRQIRVPLGHEAMRRELVFYAAWYNESRPHQALSGMTPAERYDGAGSTAKSFEPRPRWPADDGAVRVKRLQLVVTFLEGRKHLPIVELKQAA
jgi:transposase InsO family protein